MPADGPAPPYLRSDRIEAGAELPPAVERRHDHVPALMAHRVTPSDARRNAASCRHRVSPGHDGKPGIGEVPNQPAGAPNRQASQRALAEQPGQAQ